MSYRSLSREMVRSSEAGDIMQRSLGPKPGPLRGTVTLTLQTEFAQRLVAGRPATSFRNGVFGLFAFADLLRALWRGAAADDPYADWWLLKVEQALTQAEHDLQRVQAEATDVLAGLDAISISPAASIDPFVTELQFATPHAFRGAQLVGRADAIACAVLTARHIGCLPAKEATTTLWNVGRTVRKAFHAVRGYTKTGLTRGDVIACTPRAAFVVQQMGILPDGILNETLTADYRPARSQPSAGNSFEAAAAKEAADRPDYSFGDGAPMSDDLPESESVPTATDEK